MGAGSIDLESKRKRVEDLYPYESEGIAALLDDFYRVEARAYDRADLDSYTVIADLKIALDTDCLTPRQRQCIALYYFCELSREQVAELLGVARQSVDEYLATAHERLAREMKEGGAAKKGRRVKPLPGSRPLNRWINDIADGAPIYDLPEDVAEDLLYWLSERGDERAWETIRQRRHGAPELVYDTVEHAHIHDRQLWYRYKREIYDDHRNEKEDRFGFYW
ncbi:sigma-70 family RNA polymerase sigma factor [Thermoactinomyces daqus]|uniref:Sigma-70 family RNA polymerase sigma factor n=1 Tax=Thermoactinomyces daqus TaxID=1329516 RepID=A0A7W2AGB0_9BACL|nr:sigma factor-like helix-turn-helix DNA-binding protein [Thermoactinomyces daqus]MBA4542022.1 sigma-70 family RNA polymerase sigma factor [Thermoactinomyces daqus]